jgi:hypothetical protein
MQKFLQFVALAVVVVSTFGCGRSLDLVGLGDADQNAYSGPMYPATNKIAIAFQARQVAPSCRVFAQALVRLPANLSAKDIENIILGEAGKRGADQVLIGQSRQSEDDDGVRFLYYGPEKEYLCSEQWEGWKFGYELWEEQGEWVNIGYGEWGKANLSFETPMIMQAAMLRCQ